MIPGEIQVVAGVIELNAGLETRSLRVENTGDRPVQVGSHYHFLKSIRLCGLTVHRHGVSG